MNVPFYIARRYFSLKRKRKNIVHIISLISLTGICTGTMALIIVLSVYNGFGKVIEGLNNIFNPAIVIEAKEGKTFFLKDFPSDEIKKIEGTAVFTSSVEENAWLTYRGKEAIITLKGVPENYAELNSIDKYIDKGSYYLKDDAGEYAVLGNIIFQDLGISLHDYASLIRVNIPKRKKSFSLNLSENFNSGYLFPMGSFTTQDQRADQKYVLTDIDFVRKLLNYTNDEVTSVEIGLDKKSNILKIQKKIKELTGEKYTVKNRREQQELFHKIYRSEKVMIYLILLFIIFISTFNLMGSIYLLIIDKKKDIAVLKSMGMLFKDIKKLFFYEGIIISSVGIIFGAGLGILVCALQQFFGMIKIGDGFVVDSFPVNIQTGDTFSVILLVFLISVLSIGFTVSRMSDNKEGK